MATVQTIATTLTADHRPLTLNLRAASDEVDKTFAKLDARTRRFSSSAADGIAGPLKAGSNRGAQAMMELSRGVEDAAASFGTGGLTGAIRGSMNNLTQFASLMGGPIAGTVAGFAAAGVSVLTPFIAKMFEAGDAAEQMAKRVEGYFKDLMAGLKKSQEAIRSEVGFQQEKRGLTGTTDADAAIQRRTDEMEKLRAQIIDIDRRRREAAELAQPWMPDAQQQAAAQAEHELLIQELALRREFNRLEQERKQLAEERTRLEQDANAEAMDAFVEEERQRAAREQEIEKRKREAAFASATGYVDSLINGLSPEEKRRQQLESMAGIPEELKSRLGMVMGELDAMNGRRGGGLAQVATAGSQSLARLQAQTKEAAEARKQRERLIQELRTIRDELRQQRGDGLDDVNLN